MNTQKTAQKAPSEHLMEAFPEPQGMPAEWHEHDVAAAKMKLIEQEKKDKAEREKAVMSSVKNEEDAEKARHLMEKFPSLRTEPDEWSR